MSEFIHCTCGRKISPHRTQCADCINGVLAEGVKHDTGKDPWHLLPIDSLRAITKVLAFGANKYAARNWEKGMDWDRLYRATIEHMNSWFHDQEPDRETRFSHLWHAGCCVLFLIAYELRGIGNDNRPSIPKRLEDQGEPSGPRPVQSDSFGR